MKQIVDRIVEISFDGIEWHNTSMYNHYQYREEEECGTNSKENLSFDQVMEFVKAKLIPNASHSTTLFRGRDILSFNLLSLSLDSIHFDRKTWKKFDLRERFVPCMPSIKTLADSLDAQSFCEFLKDNGIQSFSINS